MYVYILSASGKPLMPTQRFGKVRHLLKSGRAKVVKREPFTIQLQYETTEYTQPVTLGVDGGSKTVGLSASTEKKEYYSGEFMLRSDIPELISTRREARRGRKNRKTRYRAARFNNRRKPKGWVPPSVKEKADCHLTIIGKICSILPVSEIIFESAAFDMQKLKADLEGLARPQGVEYQQGEQMGFWNVREYVLVRDGHKCQCCKGKSGDSILNVHHIESRKTGGDAPNNLITLCETCHKKYHEGIIKLPETIKRGAKFDDAVFMGIVRWYCFNKLKERYPGKVKMTYGYITKNTRVSAYLPKEHRIDALCIAGHPASELCDVFFKMKKIRCHNRQIYKDTIYPGGVKRRNQAPFIVKGFRIFDCVSAKGAEYYIHGRREKGAFVLKNLSGGKLEISPSKIRYVRRQSGLLIEKKINYKKGLRHSPPPKPVGYGRGTLAC